MKRFLFFILTMSLVPAVMGQAPDDSTEYNIQRIDAYKDSLLEKTNLDFGMIFNKVMSQYLSTQWFQEKLYPTEKQNPRKKPKTAPVYVPNEEETAELKEQNTSLKDNNIETSSISIDGISIEIPPKKILLKSILTDTTPTEVEAFLHRLGEYEFHKIAINIAILKEQFGSDILRTADIALKVADSLSHYIETFLADSLHEEWIGYSHKESYIQITTFYLLRLLDYDVNLGQAGAEFFIFGENELFARKETYEKDVILTSMSSFSIEDVPMSILFNKRIIHPSDLIGLTSINPLESNKPLRVYSIQFDNPNHRTLQNEAPVFHVQIRLKEIDKQEVCHNLKTPDHYCYIFSGFYLNGINNSMSIDSIDSISSTPHIILFYDIHHQERRGGLWLDCIANGDYLASFYSKLRNDTLFVAYIPHTVPDKEDDLYPAFVFCDTIMQSINIYSFPWILNKEIDQKILRQFEILPKAEKKKALNEAKTSMIEELENYPDNLNCRLIFRQDIFPSKLFRTLCYKY